MEPFTKWFWSNKRDSIPDKCYPSNFANNKSYYWVGIEHDLLSKSALASTTTTRNVNIRRVNRIMKCRRFLTDCGTQSILGVKEIVRDNFSISLDASWWVVARNGCFRHLWKRSAFRRFLGLCYQVRCSDWLTKVSLSPNLPVSGFFYKCKYKHGERGGRYSDQGEVFLSTKGDLSLVKPSFISFFVLIF